MSNGIKNPRRLFNGSWQEMGGTFWAWPVDGYWDLHFTERGAQPDGSEVIAEFFATLKEVRAEARSIDGLNRLVRSLP